MLKVPGTGEAADSASQRSHAPSKTGGIANVPVICPLCGTRMYASKDQIGQTMVCPDCLESVVVPDHSPPKPKPSPSVPDAQTPPPETDAAGASAAEQADGAEADEPDDYKLADATKLPRHLSVSEALGHLIDRHIEPAQDGVVPAERETADREVEPPASPAPPPRPRSFTVKCPVCDTMLQATEEEIGTEKKCPDCFSLIEIRRPPRKLPRVNPVVKSDEADEDFTLSEPVSLDIYKPTAEDGAPRTMGEEALRNARRARAERGEEASDLPLSPLWSGIFAFLPDVAAILRIVITGVLLGGLMKLVFVVMGAAFSPNPMHQFLGMIGSVVAVGLGVLTISLASTNFLTVLQQSADGLDRIQSWPENSLVEWVGESIPVVMAVFFAATPAMLLIVPFSGIRARPEIAGLLLGGSLYLCFPITQMSILESASVANPLSKPIVDSLRDQFLLWCTFYIMTFFLALAVVIVLSFVSLGHPTFVLVALGLFISFCGMLYARLLGRLVWACQMGVVNEEEPEGEESGQRHKNFWLGR